MGNPKPVTRGALCLVFAMITSVALAAQPLVIAKPEMFSVTQEVATAIIGEAYRRTGTAIRLIEMPTSRSLYDVKAGTLDGEVIRYADIIARTANMIPVKEPVLLVDFGVFTQESNLQVSDWKSLSAYRVGLIRGVDATARPTEGMDRVFVDTLLQLFQLLERNRVDLVLAPLIEGEYLKRQHPERFQAIHYHPPPLRGILPYYHALNARHQALAARLADALREMQEDGTTVRLTNEVKEAHLKGHK